MTNDLSAQSSPTMQLRWPIASVYALCPIAVPLAGATHPPLLAVWSLGRCKQQRGGTLLGIIIGVVLGLVVALAVAVIITKVPVPFSNKTPSRSADQDAAEAKKNKDWDPNAPLYGKNPARTASGAVVTASAPAQPSAAASSAAVAASGAAAPAAAPAKAAASSPVQTAPTAQGASAARQDGKAAAPSDPFIYFVQAGAYRSAEDADAQRARLLLLGFDAKVGEREQSGRAIYRVRLGPYEQKEEAERQKGKLEANAVEGALVRVQR